MKTKRREDWRRKNAARAKSAKNRETFDHKRNIVIYHVYDSPREKSYWDDVSFVMGKKYVMVCWTHPRYDYSEEINSKAYELANEKYGDSIDSMFDHSIKNYRKVGKSRKKIVSHTMSTSSRDEYYEYWKKVEGELLRTSEHRVGTHFKYYACGDAYMLDVCCPVEVRNEDELQQLADLMRKYLSGERSFREDFGSYTYGAAEYAAEFIDTNAPNTNQKVA